MSDERMIRVENLKLLMKQHSHNHAVAARQLECSDPYVRKLLSGQPGTFGEKTARKVEDAYKKPRFWLDWAHAGAEYTEADLNELPNTTQAQAEDDTPPFAGERKPTYSMHTMAQAATSYPLAPLINWAELGEDLYRANNEWPTSDLRAVPTSRDVSDKVKWVPVIDDSLAPEIKVGDLVAVDPVMGKMPARGQIALFKTNDGEFMLRRYQPLATFGAFEAVDSKGHALESTRHGLLVVGIVVGSFREL